MNEYYIHRDGQKLGPFSAGDLQAQGIDRNTSISAANSKGAVPAQELPELSFLFEKDPGAGIGGIPNTSFDGDGAGQAKSGLKTPSPAATRVGIRIILIVLVALLIGVIIYLVARKGPPARKSDDVVTVHEQEVQKAIQELNAEKLAKKTTEQRKKLLQERKTELKSLNAQLGQAMKQKAEALAEIDKIRRPHLFRSRAKKEAKLSEQLEIVDRMDDKAANFRRRISNAQAAIDTLSAGLSP